MQVKSIAECSKGSILQYFRPSLSYHFSLSIFVWPFYTGFTVTSSMDIGPLRPQYSNGTDTTKFRSSFNEIHMGFAARIIILVHANKTSLRKSNKFTKRVTILRTEVTQKRLKSMLLVCCGVK